MEMPGAMIGRFISIAILHFSFCILHFPCDSLIYLPAPSWGAADLEQGCVMARGSHLIVQTYAGVTVVNIDASVILDAALIQKMTEELDQLVDGQARTQIVLDFSKVRMLSSQAIGMLLSLRKKSEAIKGQAVLCGIRADLQKIFTITQIDKLFKFFDNEKSALAHFDVHMEG